MLDKSKLTSSSVVFGASLHDLKTHVTAIIAAAELLSSEFMNGAGETEQKLVAAIIRNAKKLDTRLSHLFNSNLYIDRITESNEATDISSLVKEIILELNPLIAVKKQDLSVQLAQNLPLVRSIHKQYLQFILRNLIHNASKFTPPNGKIRISAGVEEEYLVLEITDNGIGIPENLKDDIFNRASRLVNSSDGDREGSGHGLAMAKYLLEIHGGKMWYISRVGEGTTFFVSFPLNRGMEK